MKDIENDILIMLSSLEGYHQRLKEIHWSTVSSAEHHLTDEMDGMMLMYEDKLAEVAMGLLGVRFGIGKLKTLSPSAKTTVALIEEFVGDVKELRGKVDDDGIISLLDDMLNDARTSLYKATLK